MSDAQLLVVALGQCGSLLLAWWWSKSTYAEGYENGRHDGYNLGWIDGHNADDEDDEEDDDE